MGERSSWEAMRRKKLVVYMWTRRHKGITKGRSERGKDGGPPSKKDSQEERGTGSTGKQ